MSSFARSSTGRATLAWAASVLLIAGCSGGGASPGASGSATLEPSASASAVVTDSAAATATATPAGTPKRSAPPVATMAPTPTAFHGFRSTGAMPETRAWHRATLIDGGKVLIVGGVAPGSAGHSLNTALLWDPADERFHPTGSMTYGRRNHFVIGLKGGRVLVGGGSENGSLPARAELYNPATGTFSLTGSLHTPRVGAAVAVLPDARILVVGGMNTVGRSLASAEIYSPSTGLFTVTGSMLEARLNPTATQLVDGRILITGGFDNTASRPQDLKSAEIYDPATGHFTSTGSMSYMRYWHSATRLGGGKVLIAGGDSMGEELKAVELYDPATGHFTLINSLRTARVDHVAVKLQSGKVLVAGGFSPGTPPNHAIADAELYDPSTGTWIATSHLVTPREEPTATLLFDGRVLITGGLCVGTDAACAIAELYVP